MSVDARGPEAVGLRSPRTVRPLPLLLTAALLAATGCRHAPALPPGVADQLRASPDAYLTGEPRGLRERALLDNKDFVYTIAFSPDGTKAAFTHLGAKSYQLGIWRLDGEKPTQLADIPLNPYEFDVEAIDFSPDGQTLVTASRDGALRFFQVADGKALGLHATEEPLVAVAFHPSGRYVVAGSARGLLTAVRLKGFAFSFEQRAHEGEVRALAFTPAGVLFSGGWDKSIASFESVEEDTPSDRAQLRFERRNGFSVVRGTLDERVSAAFAFDNRLPAIVVNTEVAKAAGIEVGGLQDSVTLATPLGNQVARLAKGRTLSFKSLTFPSVDVAVCDACVPEGAQGVLGAPFTDVHTLAFDEVTSEVRLQRKEPSADAATAQAPGQAAPPGPSQKTLHLRARKRLSFPHHVNDLTVDHDGDRLGVAFSEVPAERNRDVYQREKRGEEEPLREGNAAAIVDAHSGLVLRRFGGHHGVVATAAISPDGQTLASGGWDKKVYVLHGAFVEPLAEKEFGWSVRRVRFTRDGRLVGVGAWTPQNPLGDQESDPSAIVFEVEYATAEVKGRRQ